jgi:hypothetical protein
MIEDWKNSHQKSSQLPLAPALPKKKEVFPARQSINSSGTGIYVETGGCSVIVGGKITGSIDIRIGNTVFVQNGVFSNCTVRMDEGPGLIVQSQT